MISAAEHTAGARQMFEKMDADGDGRVTAAEMDASRSDGGGIDADMSSAERSRPSMPTGRRDQRRRARGGLTRRCSAKMDVNGDGNLTAAELQAGHQKMMGEQPR